MSATIFNADCLAVMDMMPSASIDAIITDPPYGIGFMGKDWDKGVPVVEFWKEMLRVAKPGAYLLAFGGSRTSHRMTVAIEDAGWEIRDTIMWIYGSGFPKSHNLGDGRGTALKPAHEPIIMARKPLVGTVAANVLAYGTGVLNIDFCRVPTGEALRAGSGLIPCRHDEAVPRGRSGEASASRRYTEDGGTNFAATPGPRGGNILGRWPANVIHDGSEEVLSVFPQSSVTGVRKQPDREQAESVNTPFTRGKYAPEYTDNGSAARFFYCAKASKADREEGLSELPPIARANGNKWTDQGYRVTSGERPPSAESGPRRNTHPTVKPTELMRYLCRLVTPPCGVILDPFCGSGSTGKAAVLEGFHFIGAEREAEYAAIAKARCGVAA